MNLDHVSANRFPIAPGMGKSRNERLADHYLEAAGIAGVWIGAGYACGLLRVVSTEPRPGCRIYCCAAWSEAIALGRACSLYPETPIEQRADRYGIAITDHIVVVERALAAVDVVNRTITEMQRTGGMREFNAMFKAARCVAPSLRYHDYLHHRKAEMLTAMAREIGR